MATIRDPALAAPVARAGGYAPLRDYAAIGDGRTVALVSRDGSVDWLCLPDLDSPSVFGSLLDAGRGGRFALAPDGEFEARRRYLPGTNVLETTFTTADGAVRVTDALTLPAGRLAPLRELARRVEGVAGAVTLRWRLVPRFGYGEAPTRLGRRAGIPVATAGADAVALRTWDAGEPRLDGDAICGRFEVTPGTRALLAVTAAHGEPLVLPARDDVERRLDATASFWRDWAGKRAYDGPWREAVVRSALALKLLVHAPSGAVAAAPTTSLPERLGGERNWDYRFCWVRDSAFTADALLRLGCPAEARAYFSWLLHAAQLTQPRLGVLYRLDGGARARERTLSLDGYRSSRPVRVGNGAAGQLQLDVYGDLLQTAWLYAGRAGGLDSDTARRLAEVADLVCDCWRQPDAGIWETRGEPRHHTHSKLMCWVALDRAGRLAADGTIPGRHAARWRREAEAIRRFVDERCWSPSLGAYAQHAGGDEADASLLQAALVGWAAPDDPRLRGTIDGVRRELGRGPLLYRYRSDDGLPPGEGAFLACSFWLVDALARSGRLDEAAATMEELLALANDVGLYSEEIDPETGEFLGNLPQGLVHLALIGAATSLAEAAT
jgi:GH15 family glucan-1,4-alpha-glucosidase